MGRYLGRMRTALLISCLKAGLRATLGPFLPLVRAIRTLPKRLRADQHAAALRGDSGISVCYLTSQFPGRPALQTEIAHGGAVKLTFLAEHFPHSYPRASLLYTVSSVDHVAKATIVRRAKRNGLKVILNQNGVAYPAWHGQGWEKPNRKMQEVYEQADFIIFQSEFCRLGAEKFLGKCTAPSRVIFNPIDLDLYRPLNQPVQHNAPILLLGGNQLATYRLEVAAQVLQRLSKHLPTTRLIVTGKLWGDNQAVSMHQAVSLLRELGIAEQVEFTGQYSQKEAVRIFQRADILIHTQYNDASPTLIGEALACGVPVVYSSSGGTPELVGAKAGIGIPVEKSWEKISTPDTEKMAKAVLLVWENHKIFRESARQFAEEQFPLKNFIRTHREIFMRLLES
jgi:glycosyltransferase involved in cell wall biosynthesis